MSLFRPTLPIEKGDLVVAYPRIPKARILDRVQDVRWLLWDYVLELESGKKVLLEHTQRLVTKYEAIILTTRRH